MNLIPASTALAVPVAPAHPVVASFAAAQALFIHLQQGRCIDAALLRDAMETAFGAFDASGAWSWKQAYDACEAALVLFLRQYGKSLLRKAGSPSAALPMLERLAALMPSHTRRSEESRDLQQFSTPLALGLAAAMAAAITPDDLVLEPSAGTGLLAVLAEFFGGQLILNELAETRAELLTRLFPGIAVTRFDAAQIDDHLPAEIAPSVVLMNPPFSAMTHVRGRVADAALRHMSSALARLAPDGRLVAITGASLVPDSPDWTDAFTHMQQTGRVLFSAPVSGAIYARHGTTIDTRLTVIDKRPADDPAQFPPSPGKAGDCTTLMGWLREALPPRLSVERAAHPAIRRSAPLTPVRPSPVARSRPTVMPAPEAVDLAYEPHDWTPPDGVALGDVLYEPYRLQSIRIPGAQPHPTKLVQSAAMGSVAPPKPSYRPKLPANIHNLLSDAQLETVIYAGEAHSAHLAGHWRVDDSFDTLSAAPEDAPDAIRFRRGFMLGDGTGAGKGRQSAGIILDNWLQGRRRALWISKSDKLIEDAHHHLPRPLAWNAV